MMSQANSGSVARVFVRKTVFTILIGILSFHAKGQFAGVHFKSVTSADGLSHDIINTIVRDSQGYMWFGTFSGLNRFDGYNIEVFRNDPQDSLSINANVVRNSFCDSKGNLWFGTERGVCSWKHGKTFTRYGRGTPNEKLDVTGFAEDKLNRIWLASRKGIRFLVNGEIRVPDFVNEVPGLQDSLRVIDIFARDEFVYMVVEDRGVVVYNIDNLAATYFDSVAAGWQEIYSPDVKEVMADRGGRMWIGYKDGTISCHDPESGIKQIYHELRLFQRGDFTNELTELAEDKEGRIWAGASISGLSVLMPGATSFVTLTDIPSIGAFANTRAARYIYVDGEGTIWLGMHTTGVLYFNTARQNFFTYQRPQIISGSEGREDVLLSNWTRVVEEDPDGRLWIGTVDGISILDRRNDLFTSLRNKSPSNKVIADNSIRSLCNYQNKEMLIGTAEGFSVFDFKTRSIRNFFGHDPSPLPGAFIWGMCESEDGAYLATSRGLAFYDFYRKEVHAWQDMPELKKQLTMNARCVLQDSDGLVWVGTDGKGLVRFDPRNYTVATYSWIANDVQGGGAVLDMIDLGDSIWVGTENGLFTLNKESGIYNRVSLSSGRTPTMIASFVQDIPGYLWMTSTEGLIRFDLATLESTFYTADHGLPSNVLGTQRGFLTSDKRVGLTSLRGLILFDPKRLDDSHALHPVRITGVRTLREGNMVEMVDGHIDLDSDENFFSVELNPFDFIHQDYMTYAYKLDGFHDDWVLAGANRIITFTNVPGGNYKLLIKASASGNLPEDVSGTLSIFVATVYYKTWWFRISVGLICALLIYVFYRYRINQRKAIEALRMDIAADLHDDIGSTLSSIRLYSDVAKKSGTGNEALLEKISGNASGMIERMSDIVWAIKPGHDDMRTLAGRIRDFSLELAVPMGIKVSFTFDPALDGVHADMRIRKELYMSMKEAVNNAVKYSACNELSVHFSRHRNTIMATVEDNGIGFDVENRSGGNGLRNMRSRMAGVGGRFSIRSAPGHGTHIQFEVAFTHFG